MTKHVSTKRALVLSLLSMLLCVSMLIGSTYAWFTDTATTAVNKIQAGTLDVALEMSTDNGATWTNAEGKTLNFMTTDNREEILWEPGCTYALPLLRVVNKGNLSLKYEIVITGINGKAKLNEAIEWTLPATVKSNLAAGATSDAIAISGHMKEDAGNEYQGLSIEGIAITVYATQYTGESDSNGNTYDENAPIVYPEGVTAESFGSNVAVDGEGNYYASFKTAMESVADKGTLYFKADSTVDFATHLNVTKNVTIYANGTNFSGKDISIGTYAAPANAETTINIYNAKNLVVWGQPVGDRADVWNVNFYDCVNEGSNFLMYRGNETATAKINLTMTNCRATGYSDSTVHATADGSIAIKNCLFIGNIAPINISHKQSGTMTVTVEDSTFTACGTVDTVNQRNEYCAPARFVNNSAEGKLEVTLKNNTFAGTIGTNGDILLGDYRTGKASNPFTATIVTDKAVMVKSSIGPAYSYNGGTVEVVPQSVVNDAITKSENREVSIKLVPNSTFTLDNEIANETNHNGKSRDVTFVGDGTQTIDVAKNAPAAEGAKHLNYQRGSTFTFENLIIENGTDAFDGIVCDELIYKNCTIKGVTTLYGKATFIDCVFENTMPNQYSIWTWGGTDVTFERCTFNTNGKAILLYGQATEAKPTNLVVKNCIFNDRNGGAAGKAAIEIGNDYNATYTLTVDAETKVNGFAAGKNTGSTLWANKNSMDAAHLTVTIADNKIQ